MGLTIHYDFETSVSEKTLVKRLKQIETFAKIIGVKPLGKLIKIEPGSIDKNSVEGSKESFDWEKFEVYSSIQDSLAIENHYLKSLWMLVDKKEALENARLGMFPSDQYLKNLLNKKTNKKRGVTPASVLEKKFYDLKEKALDYSKQIDEKIFKSGLGYVQYFNVGEGCESFTLVFGKTAGQNKWVGSAFTKTQFSENFSKAHIKVCAMLNEVKNKHLLKSVVDEGDFWGTNDMNALMKSKKEFDAIMGLS